MKTEDIELSLTAHARFRSHSTGWVSNQIAEGLPHSGGGVSGRRVSIPLGKAIAWEIEQAQTTAAEPVNSERARLNREQADRIALENAKRRGELIRREDVEAMIRKSSVILRSELDGLGGRLASALAGMTDVPQIRSMLLTECRRIQQAFADACRVQASSRG